MSEEMKVPSKFNKKIIMAAVGATMFLLAAVLAITVPKRVEAGRLAEQLNLGDKYVSELNYEQAIAAYLKAIEIEPKCEDAYFALVDIYIVIGEFEQAEEILAKAEKELRGMTEQIEEKKKELERAKREKEAEVTPESMPTNTPEPTPTSTPKPTPTSTPEPTLANTPMPTPTNTPEPTPTNAPAPTLTPEPTPTNTPMPTPTPVAVFDETAAEKFRYYENEDGGITISGFYDEVATVIVVPKIIDGKAVTELGLEVFVRCRDLLHVELPSTIEKIGRRPFCSSVLLKEIKISEENPYFIAEEGVIYTKDRKKIIAVSAGYPKDHCVIRDGVEIICDSAFWGCDNIVSIQIPSSVVSIENFGFANCSNVRNIEISEGVTSLGYKAFSSCWQLKSIRIPSSVSEIGHSAFNADTIESMTVDKSNPIYTSCDAEGKECNAVIHKTSGELVLGCSNTVIPDSVSRIGAAAFEYCSFEDFEIPEWITSIGEAAFFACDNLTQIQIPEGVTDIGSEAFGWCSKLKSVEISSSVRYIASDVFHGSNIEEFIVDENNDTYTSKDSLGNECNAIIHRATMELVCSGGTEVPEGIKSIGENAFMNNDSLVDISIPDSVTSIANWAFGFCDNLRRIVLPESVEHIDEYAFSGSNMLTIVAPFGSYAEAYARENNIPFEAY